MEDERDGRVKKLYPAALAALIKADPNWKGQPVMLGGCHTGMNYPDGFGGYAKWKSFAQGLADELGVPVTAPLGFSRYDGKRGVIGSTKTADGPVSSPGAWRSFFPK
jgi:hypothetical protein